MFRLGLWPDPASKIDIAASKSLECTNPENGERSDEVRLKPPGPEPVFVAEIILRASRASSRLRGVQHLRNLLHNLYESARSYKRNSSSWAERGCRSIPNALIEPCLTPHAQWAATRGCITQFTLEFTTPNFAEVHQGLRYRFKVLGT